MCKPAIGNFPGFWSHNLSNFVEFYLQVATKCCFNLSSMRELYTFYWNRLFYSSNMAAPSALPVTWPCLEPFHVGLCCISCCGCEAERGSLGFRAAQLELSCSHQSECQDGAEQQEGQRGRERESLCDDTYAKIPNVLKVSEMSTKISQPENILSAFTSSKAILGWKEQLSHVL